MKKQTGFTLIELAIVLVIIGLLLGGVLKGQELINSAKAKNIASDLKNVQIFIYGYQDKFRAIPGDDANVATHINNGTPATTPAGSLNNAQINGAWNSITASDESFLFWQHVRLAGFATGPTAVADAAYLPRNAESGRIGVQSLNGFTTIVDPSPMTGLYVVCSENITGRLVKQIDANLDDGNTATGSLRAVIPPATVSVATAAIVDGTAYTICMAF
ncbi:prepilin-type N-terminal cleavage/methylation domain-containing protein [Methylotenera sp.]|uniref:prepilin-type N-terminal cleavage/methylation domain-containing protein n=1 Tax=Methylotenera sp. TaxID=2051956 RepID=UPI0024887E48|nr:prepilin-type N-terminal cleavage/methylation domain-containing protein [Methylotenera sp.]MDI1297589.1 prepilin-type N-terminal cleavage/methylation domain-containing protein [Methylotenera sp.]